MRFSNSTGRETGPNTATSTTTTTTSTFTTTLKEPAPETRPKTKKDKLLDGLRQVELSVRRAKEPVVTQTKERLLWVNTVKDEDEEEREGEKEGNSVNGDQINSENQERLTEEKEEGDNSKKIVSTRDDDEETEEDQELSDDEEDEDVDDLGEESEIHDELNRQAKEIFLTLLRKNEEDLEQKDENLVARLQELEAERIKILQMEYPYSFTQWVERKWEMSVQEKEKRKRREELKEQSLEKEEEERKKAKKFRKQRKFLKKKLARAKELMQRGANKGDKEMTEEEGHGTIKEKQESKEGKRKQVEQIDVVEEEEKVRPKQEEKHYRGLEEAKVIEEEEEEERLTRGMDQKRKTKEVKNQSTVERERLQEGVEKEAEAKKQGEKKMKILKLEIRQVKRDTTKHDPEERRELPMMEKEKKETNVKQKGKKNGAFRQAAQKRTPEGTSRAQQEAGGGGRLVGAARRLFHKVPPQQVSRSQNQAPSRNHISQMSIVTKKISRPSSYLTMGSQTAVGRAGHHRRLPAVKSIDLQVFVVGVPRDTTPDQLRVAMGQFGAVADVDQPRGGKYAFVAFEEKDGRKIALQAGVVSLPGGPAFIKPYRSLRDRRADGSGLASFPQRPVFRGVASQGRVTASRGASRRVLSPALPPGRCEGRSVQRTIRVGVNSRRGQSPNRPRRMTGCDRSSVRWKW